MYLIGIDGGGTKTTVILAGKEGNVLKMKQGGPSNLRNVGIGDAAKKIYQLIDDVIDDKSQIALSYIALAAIDEEFFDKKEEILKELKSAGLKGKIVVAGDQLAAFRSGSSQKNGLVAICGTGAAVHGWRNGREAKASGWGFFADEGSAFYIGIEGYRAALKSIDGRINKTEIADLIYEKWKIKDGESLNRRIYSNFMENLPAISLIVSQAADNGDESAQGILKKAGEEMLLSVRTVAGKLEIEDDFPLVLVGGTFSSSFFSSFFKKRIQETYSSVKIILPTKTPAEGAVSLAVEHYKNIIEK